MDTKKKKRGIDLSLYHPSDIRKKYGKLVGAYNARHSDRSKLRFLFENNTKFNIVLSRYRTGVVVKMSRTDNEMYKSILAAGGDIAAITCVPFSKPLPLDDGTLYLLRLMNVTIITHEEAKQFVE
jgi:hypothetical protein